MTDIPKVSLINLKDGKAVKLFNHVLVKVIKNILDPATSDAAARTASLELKFKPDKNSNAVAVEISCKSKTAAPVALNTTFFIGEKDGDFVAYEDNPLQRSLFPKDEPEGAEEAEEVDEPEGAEEAEKSSKVTKLH